MERRDRDSEGDSARFSVDAAFYADVPRWWLRLTSPVSLDWKRQAVAAAGLALVGFAIGFAAAKLLS